MILASRSPRRVKLMRDAGYVFRAVPADIDETPHPSEEPLALVERLARAKATRIVLSEADDHEIVIAADTVVVAEGEPLGKPADVEEARRMLKRLSGRSHQVATGVCIALGATSASGPAMLARKTFTVITEVAFYPLTSSEIAAYVASGEPLDKAGAYGIQDPGGRMLVERISGDFYNVMGLPIAAVARHLRRFCDENGLGADLIEGLSATC